MKPDYQPERPFQCSFPTAEQAGWTERGSMADGRDKWRGTGIAGFSPADADFLAAPPMAEAVPSWQGGNQGCCCGCQGSCCCDWQRERYWHRCSTNRHD